MPNARPTIDLDADNSTRVGRDYETTVISGSLGTPAADTDIQIADADGAQITAAVIKVNDADIGDLLTINGVLPAGITATAYDPATGMLRLTGAASLADYQAAIHQVNFSTTDAPGSTESVGVFVFDGTNWSPGATAFIHVVAGDPITRVAAVPPLLDLDADNSNGGGADYTASWTPGTAGTPIADVDVTITDADSTTIASAIIKIQNWNQPSGDTLSIAGSLPAGITASAYDSVNLTITLSGVATLADYQTALQHVVFSSTNPVPGTGDRGIQVTVNDGLLNSNIATTYMHVAAAPANAAPVLNLDANSSTTGGLDYLTEYTGGGSPVTIADTDVLITDTDNTTMASATITLTNHAANDLLTFNGTPPTGITASLYDSSTGILTLTGTASLAAYQAALLQITFSTTGTPVAGTRTINEVVNDGLASSAVAHAFIAIDPGNVNAPVVDLDADDSTAPGTVYRTTFTENGTPVAIADTDISITDIDSTQLTSVTITLTSPQTGDLLSIAGALPTGIVASAYDPVTGILILSGSAILADYQTAIQAIRFSSAGDNPVAGNRAIQVVANDGTNNSEPAIAFVTVQTVDDPPALAVAANASYAENGAPVTLSPAPTLTITDPDSATLSSAVVRIATGSFAGDGDVLSVGGATSGTVNGITFNWLPALHTLVFNGAASAADYQTLLQTVDFQSTGDNPTDFGANPARILNWSVTDGSNVTTAAMTLDVIAVNDAPQLTLAATAAYTENGAPLALSPAATVADPDNTDLIDGQVQIAAGAVTGDILTVNGLQSGTFAGIAFSYDPALHVLTFAEPTSVADYQAFIQAIEFHSTSDDPTSGGSNPTRTLSWMVSDGDADSVAQSTILTITAVNDAPSGTDNTVTTPEDTGYAFTTTDFGFGDVDGNSLLAVTIATLPAVGTLTDNGAAVTAGLSISAADIAAGLLLYTPPPNASGSALTNFTFQVQDDGGTANGGIDLDPSPNTVTVDVTAVNDPLAIDLDANDSSGVTGAGYATAFAENGAAVPVTDTDVLITDDVTPVMSGALVFFSATGPMRPGDSLAVSGTLPAGISATVAPDGSSVSLSGLALAADYQTALHQIVFSNSSDNPDTTPRVIVVEIVDSEVATAQALTTINISAVNDAPVAQDGAANGNEDTSINGTLVATDVENDALTYRLGTQAAHGTVVVNPDGSFTYTPAQDFNGSDSFTFLANDGAADSNAATISLAIRPVNDAPVAQDGSASGSEDTPLTGALVATDVENDTLTYRLGTQAAHGTVVVNPGGMFTYTPSPDFDGTDSFTFIANDGMADSNTATIGLTVSPINDPPMIVSNGGGDTATVSIPENTTAVTTVQATDIDSPSLTYSILGGDDGDKFQIDGSSGVLSFSAAPDFETPTDSNHDNSYLVTVRASDGSLFDDQAITVQVTDVDETTPTATVHWMKSVDAGSHPDVGGAVLRPGDVTPGWQPIGIGDFNGDATSDLAWYKADTNGIDIWKLSGGAWAGSAQPGTHPVGYQPAGFGDFNGDGTDDILWFNSATGNVDLWKISNGLWAGSIDVGSHAAGSTPSGAGDFNGDGTDDILWYNASTNDAEVWLISNGQQTASVDIGPHPAGYQPALIGDFNGDGTSDIGWYNSSTGDVDIWKIANGQWAGSVDVGPYPAGWQPLGAADFNRDGTSDIAWYNPTASDIDIWLIDGAQWAASDHIGTHPPGWTAVGIGDFDHSGVNDIMWFNPTTGEIDNWLLAYS